MLSVETAESLILEHVQPLDPLHDREEVSLLSARDRWLAEAICSQLDFPHWDNSAMDGYAVRYEDVQAATPDRPITLTLIEEIPAGYCPKNSVGSGQAARILTGSMMPEGADTIVIQENTARQGDRVIIQQAPTGLGQFVRHRASFYRAGEILLAAGLHLGASEIAVLAAAQCLQVPVYRRPRVAILSTGSELVTPEQPLKPGQIVDSNQYALAALVSQMGAEPILLGIVPDAPDALQTAISTAVSQADVVISSGGVSVGDYDYVDRILGNLGARLHIRSIAVKPGKPLTFATFPGAARSGLYFGLPGNPVSALVTFLRFVQPALKKLSGQPAPWHPIFVQAETIQTLTSDGKRESYLWGQIQVTAEGYTFSLAAGSHSSGNLINLAGTNSLARIPIGVRQIAAGSPVSVMLMQR